MNPIDFALHLSSFAAPACIVALLVAAGAPVAMKRSASSVGWRGSFATNFAAGLAVSAAGLWFFGNDGKMATYAAMVVAVATTQWLTGQGWRR